MGKRIYLLLVLAALASASDDKTDRATLKGVKAVCVVVEVEDQGQAAKSGLSRDQLRSDMEGKFRKAGIALDKDSTTCVYLNIRMLQAIGRPNFAKKEKPIALF